MTLGEKIYKLRTEKNLSQGDLSEMLEVSRQSISKWENGGATPDLDKIIKLSEIFGITIDELVKSENVSASEEPKTAPVIIKKESNFPPRKIIGTVLLSLSVIITVVLLAAGGGISGLVLSSPFILCGIICFVFKKNVGLWCSWAIFFCVDMYMRTATGINWHNIRNTFIWTYDMNYARLALSFVPFIALIVFIVITVLRFGKIPLENKKAPLVFWAVFALLRLGLFVFSKSEIYIHIMTNIISYSAAYTLCYSLFDWLCVGFFVAAVVFTARYLYTKKNKSL